MAIWNKLRSELDRAGRAAHDALDEGKLHLEVFRARQLVDRAAQSLGYAVYRSRTGLESLDDASLARLTDAMRERQEELAALEDRMREVTSRPTPSDDAPSPDVSSEPPVPRASDADAADSAHESARRDASPAADRPASDAHSTAGPSPTT
ncbi:MAG: hypothetical protein ABI910_05960 [Gemmatimonadota bacterium]